jgi:cold shock CspA family protein
MSEAAVKPDRMAGKIRKLVPVRGYGFISGEDGGEYFFHFRHLSSRSSDPERADELKVGALVAFTPKPSFIPAGETTRVDKAVSVDLLPTEAA